MVKRKTNEELLTNSYTTRTKQALQGSDLLTAPSVFESLRLRTGIQFVMLHLPPKDLTNLVPPLAALHRRSDYHGLVWSSDCHSLEILPQVNLTWADLRTFKQPGEIQPVQARILKPIGDLGASTSTFAAECALRGIPCVPIDLQVSFEMSDYRSIVREGMNKLRDHYCGIREWPVGFEHTEIIARHQWDIRCNEAISQAQGCYLRADIAHIPLPDRCFSVTIVNDAVPKHSATFEAFLQEQLPEILRVTEQRAVIFPLAIFKSSIKEWVGNAWRQDVVRNEGKLRDGTQREILRLETALFADQKALMRICAVAEQQGFSFKLQRSVQAPVPGHPEQDLGNVPALGVFTRIGESGN